MQKNYPPTRHTDHLTVTTSRTRPHTPDTHNPQMKRKRKEKGVVTSLSLSATCWPLASLVSRRHARLEGSPPRNPFLLRAPSPLHSSFPLQQLNSHRVLSLALNVSNLSLFPVHTRAFYERGPASFFSSHAPAGRASALSANRESGHASCSST